jgi:curved DNA-binding protein CbpA
MLFAEALTLFRRLGVDVETMSSRDFSLAYFALAKRFHPDRNPRGAELMANINAAREIIVNSHRSETL